MKKKGLDATVRQDKAGKFTEEVMPYPRKRPDQQGREGTTVSYTDKTGKTRERFIPQGGSYDKVFGEMATADGEKGK